jgi:hypothetical protein
VQPSSWSPFLPSSQTSPSIDHPVAAALRLTARAAAVAALDVAVVAALASAPCPRRRTRSACTSRCRCCSAVVRPLVALLVPLPPSLHTCRRRTRRQAQVRAVAVARVVGPPRRTPPPPPPAGTRPRRPRCRAIVGARRSVSTWLPSSQASVGATIPSPQLARAQSLLHSLSSTSSPSSQPSPGPTKPSPHTLTLQSDLHAAVSALSAPLSHSSPGPDLTVAAGRQLALGRARLARAVARPSSHSSPASRLPSPQNGSGGGSSVVVSSPVEVVSSPVEVEPSVDVIGLVEVVGSEVGAIDVWSVVPVPLIDAVPTVASVVGGAVGSVSPGDVVDVPKPVDDSELLAEPATTSSPQPPSIPAREHTNTRFKPLVDRIATPPRKLSQYRKRRHEGGRPAGRGRGVCRRGCCRFRRVRADERGHPCTRARASTRVSGGRARDQ